MSISACLRFTSAPALVAVMALSGTSVRSQTDVRPINDLLRNAVEVQ